MSTRSILIIALISTVAFTGCKTVYSSVYTNKKNSFKPPVTVASNELKAPEAVDVLANPVPGGLPPGGDQNTLPGIPGLAAPVPPAAPDTAPAIPGL